MNARFVVRAKPRRVSSAAPSGAGAVTLAWHAVRQWHEEARQRREELATAWTEERSAWIALADEAFRLGAIIEQVALALEQAGSTSALAALRVLHRRWTRRLAEQGLECLAPVGEPYTPDLSDLIENVAQQACPETKEPVVLEMVEPAILRQGVLLRPGKATIGVPSDG